jgi:hypothetical protein
MCTAVLKLKDSIRHTNIVQDKSQKELSLTFVKNGCKMREAYSVAIL